MRTSFFRLRGTCEVLFALCGQTLSLPHARVVVHEEPKRSATTGALPSAHNMPAAARLHPASRIIVHACASAARLDDAFRHAIRCR
jgi:hypothetical protein